MSLAWTGFGLFAILAVVPGGDGDMLGNASYQIIHNSQLNIVAAFAVRALLLLAMTAAYLAGRFVTAFVLAAVQVVIRAVIWFSLTQNTLYAVDVVGLLIILDLMILLAIGMRLAGGLRETRPSRSR